MATTKFGFKKLVVNNYPTWSKHMKGLLAMKGYRGALTDPEDNNTVQAQGIMLMCVEDCHLTVVESADNAMEAWNALAALYQQQSSANVLRLKREMANLEKMREESITEFISRVSALREQIGTATGNAIQDADVICAILSALPSRYNTIKTIIETMPNLPSLSDVTAKLLMVEADQTKGNDIIYFSHTATSDMRSKVVCWYCGEMGHMKKDCPVKEKADKVRPKAGKEPKELNVVVL
jgi:hypothetical protein